MYILLSKTCFIDKLVLSSCYQLLLTTQKQTKMNNLKKGDLVAIKGTTIEGEIAYASTILQNNFYLIVDSKTGLILRDSFGDIKDFFAEDLDYTKEQKEWMEQDALNNHLYDCISHANI